VSRRNQLVIAFLVLGFVGSVPLIIGAAWKEIQLGTGGTVTTAIVTAKEVNTAARNPDFCVLLFSFVEPRTGRVIRSSDGRNCGDWPAYDQIKVGDPIAVRYLPDNPDANRLEARPFRFEDIGLVALWCAVAVAVAVYGVRRLRHRGGAGTQRVALRSSGEPPDPLLPTAIELIAGRDRVTVRDLQDGLNVAYGPAQRVFDELGSLGYLGPFDGTDSREVRHSSGH
jgi:hypothetical protein